MKPRAVEAGQPEADNNRVRINSTLRTHINAFASLVAILCHRPTQLTEIVPQDPTLVGATDAAKQGMGGVYFDHLGKSYLWRLPFPPDIQANLVSTDNPNGMLTNSDLEHTGLLWASFSHGHHPRRALPHPG